MKPIFGVQHSLQSVEIRPTHHPGRREKQIDRSIEKQLNRERGPLFGIHLSVTGTVLSPSLKAFHNFSNSSRLLALSGLRYTFVTESTP